MKKIFCILLFCVPFFICAQNNKPTLAPLFNQKDTSVLTQHDTDRFVVFHFEEVRHVYDSIPLEINVALRAIHYTPKEALLKQVLVHSVVYDTTIHTSISGDWWKFQFEKRTVPIVLEYYGDTIYVQSMHGTELIPEHINHLLRAMVYTGIFMCILFFVMFLFGIQRNNKDISWGMHTTVITAMYILGICITCALTSPYRELPHLLLPAIGGLIALIAGMWFWQKKMKKVK